MSDFSAMPTPLVLSRINASRSSIDRLALIPDFLVFGEGQLRDSGLLLVAGVPVRVGVIDGGQVFRAVVAVDEAESYGVVSVGVHFR